jgi:hypothetical protein
MTASVEAKSIAVRWTQSTLLPVISAAILAVVCPSAAAQPAESPLDSDAAEEPSSETQPIQQTPHTAQADPRPEQVDALARLSVAWRDDWVLNYSGHEPPFAFPSELDRGEGERGPDGAYLDPTLPSWFIHLSSIPFHHDDRLVRVYLGCTSAPNPHQCSQWEVRIYVYNPTDASTTFIEATSDVSCTGNSGAHLIPFAVAPDDAHLILEAWMGDPGAGGSSHDYGFAMIPIAEGDPSARYLTESQRICREFSIPASARFYDDFARVVYDRPGYSGPLSEDPEARPIPHGRLIVQDVATGRLQTLLEEPDTDFFILEMDESAHTALIEARRYTFPPDCPRELNDVWCAEWESRELTIQLP